MAQTRTRTVTVYRVSRGNNSPSGNPRFTFHTDGGNFRTEVDGAINYDVGNAFKVGATLDLPVTLHLRGSSVVGWEVITS